MPQLFVRTKGTPFPRVPTVHPTNDPSLTTVEGFLINPPDLRSNTQRIFVPRSALESLTVLAVIGATRRRRKAALADTRQVPMFGE